MEGSVFIVFEEGWACSNVCKLDVERDIFVNEEGAKVSKQTNTLKINAIFTGKSELKIDSLVDCVFRVDETDSMTGYKGRVTLRHGDLTVINILSTITEDIDIKKILNKIII